MPLRGWLDTRRSGESQAEPAKTSACDVSQLDLLSKMIETYQHVEKCVFNHLFWDFRINLIFAQYGEWYPCHIFHNDSLVTSNLTLTKKNKQV